MNYCIKYDKHSSIRNDVDELIIEYSEKDNTFLEFLELYKEKRIIISNIEIKYLYEKIDFFSELCNKYNNIVFLFDYYFNEYDDMLKEFQEKGMPYFFNKKINNWDELNGYISLGVSDVYIVEDMGFDLEAVKNAATVAEVRVRAFANVAQSSFNASAALKKFFIRPEDIELYSDYIDTIEFFGDTKQQEVLYKIYTKDQKWFGKLNELILDFNSDIDSRYIIPRFAERRINCRKDCVRGGKCRMCERIEALSHTLEEANLIIKMDKEKGELEDGNEGIEQ